MKVITAPEKYEIQENDICAFLAGGISGCPNWQKKVLARIKNLEKEVGGDAFDNLIIFNPRRDKFDVKSKDLANEQIEWEFKYLNRMDIFSMYFCKETIQPICLYELGRYIEVMKKRFPETFRERVLISVEPKYERAVDVVIQANLALEYENAPESMHLWLYTASYENHADDIVQTYLTIDERMKRQV